MENRVKCRYCRHSDEIDPQQANCNITFIFVCRLKEIDEIVEVDPDGQCFLFTPVKRLLPPDARP